MSSLRGFRACLTIFVVSGMMGPRAFAQSSCQVDGPTTQETADYIHNVMVAAGTTDQFYMRYLRRLAQIAYVTGNTVEVQDTYRIFEPNGPWASHQEEKPDLTAPINSLDCGSFGIEARDYGYLVYVRCRNNANCTSSGSNAFGLPYRGDAEHANRLASALSHLVSLAQVQWRQEHDDPKDPFKK